MKIVHLALLSCLVACSSTPPARTASEAAPADTRAAKAPHPDQAKTAKHMREHVKYPASREAILAACADTPEFSSEEKKWLSDNLPAGEYKNADDVINALRL
jgi:hypothetical protein